MMAYALFALWAVWVLVVAFVVGHMIKEGGSTK